MEVTRFVVTPNDPVPAPIEIVTAPDALIVPKVAAPVVAARLPWVAGVAPVGELLAGVEVACEWEDGGNEMNACLID